MNRRCQLKSQTELFQGQCLPLPQIQGHPQVAKELPAGEASMGFFLTKDVIKAIKKLEVLHEK